jgi:phage terminase large subunit-like protein
MSHPGDIPAALALAHLDPSCLEGLSDAAALVAAFEHDAWLRPAQRFPANDWRSCGFLGGRGTGKSHAIACEFNRRVESGECTAPALMGPTDDRVRDVQVKFLTELSPPWFKAVEHRGGVVWPNGVWAIPFSSETPGRSRSGNFDFAWCLELIDWQGTEALAAFKNLKTATRIGRAQLVWDTTSKGSNAIIDHVMGMHESNPIANPVIRGTSFDNPLLSTKYLTDLVASFTPGTQGYDEEVLGKIFGGAAGALWSTDVFNATRRPLAPLNPSQRLIGLDPGLASSKPGSDPSGIVTAELAAGEVYVTEDHSGPVSSEHWGPLIVALCERGHSGVIVETNHAGDLPTSIIRAHAHLKGMAVHLLKREEPFPPHMPGRIYVKEVTAASSKASRAGGPAALWATGQAHIVGTLPELERECTTWVPGTRKSPNRLDAVSYVVSELAGLGQDEGNILTEKAAADALAANAELVRALKLGAGQRGGLSVGDREAPNHRGTGRLGL